MLEKKNHNLCEKEFHDSSKGAHYAVAQNPQGHLTVSISQN